MSASLGPSRSTDTNQTGLDAPRDAQGPRKRIEERAADAVAKYGAETVAALMFGNWEPAEAAYREMVEAMWQLQVHSCDCPLNPHHRWNCNLTPIWAQTMRDLDVNPWTVISGCLEWNQLIKDVVFAEARRFREGRS